jgi:hypothetical protein
MSVEDIEDAASRPDEENPEWTHEDFRRARPALTAIAEIFGDQLPRRSVVVRTLARKMTIYDGDSHFAV